MGNQPVKLKAVVYALSPFQQKVMTGLWKDLPEKIHHNTRYLRIGSALFSSPLPSSKNSHGQRETNKSKLGYKHSKGHHYSNLSSILLKR
ncbi:hypothetical protein Bca4012_024665 [Brassica carinata]